MKYYYLHKLSPQIFFPIMLTSQNLPNLPPLDADEIIRDSTS